MIVAVQVTLVLLGLASSVTSQGILPGIGDVCFFPQKAGNCKAYFPSFYYRPETGFCDCFVYTGCDGNPNRFDTLEECMGECSVPQNQQIVSTTCRNIFSGTEILKAMIKQFDSPKRPPIDIRDQFPFPTFDPRRPVLPTLPTTTTRRPPTRRTTPITQRQPVRVTTPTTQHQRHTLLTTTTTTERQTSRPFPTTEEQPPRRRTSTTTKRPPRRRPSTSSAAHRFFQVANHFWLDDD